MPPKQVEVHYFDESGILMSVIVPHCKFFIFFCPRYFLGCKHQYDTPTVSMSPPCQFYNTGFIHFKPSLYNYHAEVI